MTEPLPDNVIRNPNRGFETFLISEIYVPGGTGRYVPNINDLIIDYTSGFYRCTAVDYTTGISVLTRWDPPRQNAIVDSMDVLLGSGPGRASESYRAYLDTSVVPYILALDSRLHLYGTGNRYAKFFRGTDISQTTGQVISQYYDQNQTLLGENIPLETVGLVDATNIAIQTPVVGYTMTQMPDGEVVTVVIYDDAGNVVSVNYVTVKNSTFIRSVDQSLEYIVSIAIDSPYLSPGDPTTIEIPVNMVVDNIPMMGVVTYNSGRVARIPIDGTKMELLGLENYIATRAGQTVPVALTYKMGSNEYSYDMVVSVNNHITVPYQIRTAEPDLAYSVRMYAYPEWVDAITGYQLKFYLTNLEREYVWDVTPYVVAGEGSRAFDPTQYGVLQRVSFMVNLALLDPQFTSYHHVETYEFVLIGPPSEADDTTWEIGFEPNQAPRYGVSTQAVVEYQSANNWRYDISMGLSTLSEWLAAVYYRTLPLYNTLTEEQPPTPTHFNFRVGTHHEIFPISQWNVLLQMHEGADPGDLVYIEFIRRVSDNDLQLAVAAMPIAGEPAGT